MKKLTILLIITLYYYNIYANDQIIPNIIYESVFPENLKRKDTLLLRKYFKDNFNDSSQKKYVAFYYPKDDSDQPFFMKVILYGMQNNTILNRYEMYESVYFQYNDIDIKIVKKLEQVFGAWNGYYFSYDLNGNGIKEIILLPYSGRGLGFSIYEIENNKLIHTLSNIASGIAHFKINTTDKSFSLYYPYQFEEHKNGYLAKTYKWNAQKGLYEMVKKQEEVEFK